mmetsp:Transcript_30589/g.87718  ORF Transcript_30589/g.87718 Transcript_30589/m.87718 type:complete len:287 (-) Transcript_30589:41-901(-)
MPQSLRIARGVTFTVFASAILSFGCTLRVCTRVPPAWLRRQRWIRCSCLLRLALRPLALARHSWAAVRQGVFPRQRLLRRAAGTPDAPPLHCLRRACAAGAPNAPAGPALAVPGRRRPCWRLRWFRPSWCTLLPDPRRPHVRAAFRLGPLAAGRPLCSRRRGLHFRACVGSAEEPHGASRAPVRGTRRPGLCAFSPASAALSASTGSTTSATPSLPFPSASEWFGGAPSRTWHDQSGLWARQVIEVAQNLLQQGAVRQGRLPDVAHVSQDVTSRSPNLHSCLGQCW